MVVGTSRAIARAAPRLRNAVLVLFALLVAHDAVYIAQFGFRDSLAVAMREGGHDGYWLPFTIVAVGAAACVFVGTLVILSRLERRRAPSVTGPGSSYLGELAATWIRLLPTVAVLFVVQENIEHYLSRYHLLGLAPLGGAGYALALPVLALTTFVLAAVGSLLRWRIRVLVARVRAARARFARPRAARIAREWLAAAAPIPHRWMLLPTPDEPRPGSSCLSDGFGRPSGWHPAGAQERFTPMHRFRAAIRRMAAVFAACFVALLFTSVAFAHEERDVSGYSFAVGFIDEPVYVGQKSGLEFFVNKGDTPVEGLEKTVKAEVIYQGQKRDLPLNARFGQKGAYESVFIPTAAGPYTFHLTGTVDGGPIDQSFTSSPTGFDDVKEVSSGQFPVQFPAQAELVADAQAGKSASSQLTLAMALGAAGLVVGLVALGLALAARRRSA